MIKKFISLNKQLSSVVAPYFKAPENLDQELMKQLITGNAKNKCVLEVGCSSRPVFEKETFKKYVGLDVDDAVNSVDAYDEAFVQSVEEAIPGKYDLVFSKYLHEHVPNNTNAIREIAKSLTPGGKAVFLVPCGFHPYSIATRLVGNKLQRILIKHLRPQAASYTGYPVFYDKCTPSQFCKLLQDNGLKIDVKVVQWGAIEYFNFFVPLYIAIGIFNKTCRVLNIEVLASGLVVTASKPNSSAIN